MAQTAGVINGTDFLIYLGGVAVSYSNSCSMTISGPGTASVVHKDSGTWAQKLKKKGVTWTASVSGALALDGAGIDMRELFQLLADLTTVNVKMSTNTAGNLLLQGMAVATSVTWDAPDDEFATFSAEFEGLGRLLAAVT